MLCLAVMLSVMVVGAGAAFSDQDKIENTEAVDACSALNIINGYEDGAFHPERNIKRAEVTKMICVALNAGEEPNTSTNAVPTFDDVRGTTYAWAEGYIESCVAQGIVDGVGGKRFSPAGNVTGAQLAKMLLVSLGYNATTEKFTGAAWETYVNVRASQKHLYDGLDKMDTSAPVTRDQAAQMIWNALQAYVVEYKDGVVQDKVVGETKDKITLLYDKYEAVVETGSITEAPSSNVNPKGIKFLPQGETDAINFRNATQDVSDLLGYEVKVVYKANKTDKKDAIYGIYKTENNKDYTATWKDIEQDDAKVKFDGKSYKLDGTIDVYANGYKLTTGWTSAAFDEANLADQVTFIDSNGDGKIDAAQVKTQNVTKVTYVGNTNMDTKDLIATNKGYKPFNPYDNDPDLKDVTVYEGIAKNDYAKVSYDYYNDKVVYEKIAAVEAKVEATRTTGNGTKEIRIDGTWYEPADGYPMPSIVANDTISYVAIGNLLYNVEKTDGTWGSKSLAVVYDVAKYGVGSKANELEVSFITRDGAKKTALLDKYNNIEVTTPDNGVNYAIDFNMDGTAESTAYAGNAVKNAMVGHLVTYRESGNEVSLMPVSATQKAGYDDVYETAANTSAYTHSDNTLNVAKVNNVSTSGSRDIADNAVVFVYTSDDAKILTGKELDNAAGGVTYTTIASQVALGGEENGVKYIQAVALGVDTMPTTTGSNYAYVLNASETVDGDDLRYFELWTSKGLLKAYEKTSEMYTYEGGEIVTYEVVSTADGKTVVKDVDPVGGQVMGAITSDGLYGANNNEISIGGRHYDMANDYTLLNVDTDKKAGIEGDAAKGARAAKAGTYNILYILNGKNEVEFAMVDGQNNEIKTVKTLSGASYTNAQLGFDKTNYVVLSNDANITDPLNLVKGKSLTAEGDLTLDSGSTIAGDVVVKGNLTLSGATTVTGTLKVEGTITNVNNLSGTGSVTYKGITNTADATKAAVKLVKANAANYSGGTVVLTFDKALDASTVVAGNFTFGGTSAPTVDSVSLSADQKVVTVTYTGTINTSDDTTLTVNDSNVKDYTGQTINSSNNEVAFAGTTQGNDVTAIS